MSQEHTVNVGQGGNSQFQVVDNSKPLMKHEDLIEESVSRQEDEEEQPRQFPQYINEDGTRNSVSFLTVKSSKNETSLISSVKNL